jgi:hypothetical protein
MRARTALSTALSLHGGARAGAAKHGLSVTQSLAISSSLSIRACSRFEIARSLSTLDMLALGSTVSVRNFVRVGSTVS